MIPSPNELAYFLEVAGTLNMSRAADRLGLSQPALTLAMRRLEDSFGQQVLIRGKTGVQLTKAGEKLVSQARSLFMEWDRIKRDAAKEESDLRGRYIIGCHPSVALYTLPHFLPNLMSKYPDVEIKLHHDISRKITEDVVSYKVDFGIVVNPVRHPDLVIKPLMEDEVTLYAASRRSPLQESGKAVLICDPDLLQTQTIMRQISKTGLGFTRVVTSSNLEVVTGLVAAGCGVGILPGRVAHRIENFGLRPLPGMPRFKDKICLVYRADAQKSKASHLLIQQIAENLQ